ncbi:MAG: protein phosphatase 2C domain-containing protein [Pyrinomonadaceae bacterium]
MQTELRILSASVTDRGLSEKRLENEDSYLEMPGIGLYAVADGVGGAQAGEVASQMATEILAEAFSNVPPGSDAETVMRSAIEKANAAIYQMALQLPQLSSMATTVVALHLSDNIATIGHVGDSRLYRLDRSGELRRETNDHSVVAEEVRAGRMTEEQAENHPSRNVISRALGAEQTVDVDLRTIMVEPGTAFLICSDGITRHVGDNEIKGVLSFGGDPAEICDYLKQLCYGRGAEDNLTAVVVKVATGAERSNGHKPSAPDTEAVTLDLDEPTEATARAPIVPALTERDDDDDLLELDTVEPAASRDSIQTDLEPPEPEFPVEQEVPEAAAATQAEPEIPAEQDEPQPQSSADVEYNWESRSEYAGSGSTTGSQLEPDTGELQWEQNDGAGSQPTIAVDDADTAVEQPTRDYPSPPAVAEPTPYQIESVEPTSSAGEGVPTADSGSSPISESWDSFYKEEAPSESGSKAATAAAMLLIGALIGLVGSYFFLAPGPPPTTNLSQTEMRSGNVPLTAFEESRRIVDKTPAEALQRFAVDPRDAEDFFLLGRAHLLLANYPQARAAFLSAKERIAAGDVDANNTRNIETDIAIGMAVISDSTIQSVLKKELESGTASSTNTNAKADTIR